MFIQQSKSKMLHFIQLNADVLTVASKACCDGLIFHLWPCPLALNLYWAPNSMEPFFLNIPGPVTPWDLGPSGPSSLNSLLAYSPSPFPGDIYLLSPLSEAPQLRLHPTSNLSILLFISSFCNTHHFPTY